MATVTPSAVFDSAVRLEIFRALITTTRPPTVEDLARSLGSDSETIAAALERLNAGRAIVLQPDTREIWMANPFSCVPTPFEVRSGGKKWFGNCIWDSFGILGLLGQDGEIRTRCPDCGDAMEVRSEEGRLAGDGGLVHFAIPAANWWDDIGYT